MVHSVTADLRVSKDMGRITIEIYRGVIEFEGICHCNACLKLFGWNKLTKSNSFNKTKKKPKKTSQLFERLTWPKLPHIFACMEGYICFSLMVIVMSLSRIAVTRCRLASSLCLQKRTKLRSQGVIYSRHRCFSSIPKAPKRIHTTFL